MEDENVKNVRINSRWGSGKEKNRKSKEKKIINGHGKDVIFYQIKGKNMHTDCKLSESEINRSR